MVAKVQNSKVEVDPDQSFSSVVVTYINSSNLDDYQGKKINVENAEFVSTRYGPKLMVVGNVEGETIQMLLSKPAMASLVKQGIKKPSDMIGESFTIGKATIMGKLTAMLTKVDQ